MVLARLLDPKDFGLVGMVTAVTGVFNIFKDAGLSLVTIQRPTITNEEVSTLFWLNMGVGVILGLLSFAMAPILVMFYHEPTLFWVTAVLATGFVLNAAGVQHSALLQRDLKFGILSAVEIAAQLVSTAAGIVLALSGYGFWALVAMTVVSPAVSTLLFWLSAGWVPGRLYLGTGIRSMLRFGGTATLNGLVTYASYNIEKVLLGRFWGAEALGVYGRASQLIAIPSENLNAATGGVLFSALSRLQDDPNRFKNYFLKSYTLLLSLTLPATIGCALFADDIVFLILGQKWTEAGNIFRFLAPAITVLAIINPTYWLVISLGMAERSLKIALAIGPLVIAAYVMGLPYGPTGVALAYSIAMTVWLIPHMIWTTHGTMLSLRDMVLAAGKPLIATVTAVSVVYAAQSVYGAYLPPVPRLAAGGAILTLVYLWVLLWVMGQKQLYLDLFRGLDWGKYSARVAG